MRKRNDRIPKGSRSREAYFEIARNALTKAPSTEEGGKGVMIKLIASLHARKPLRAPLQRG
jgi:hypothetical protein